MQNSAHTDQARSRGCSAGPAPRPGAATVAEAEGCPLTGTGAGARPTMAACSGGRPRMTAGAGGCPPPRAAAAPWGGGPRRDEGGQPDGGGEAAVAHAPEAATAKAPELRVPRLFQVVLHNDDYTTMEFVVMCLMRVFHRSEPEAVNIMLAIHKQGAGVAGTYSFEVAEARQQKVSRMAREHEYPLKCTLEPA